ncbi:non-ribosomal peptide synthetase [Pseudoalteromonas sp. S16_S37]|uniref:non-ribosomal peptide synthetase n=1 Tax=Pseudoalteromonas sp. S16_S37 TaxID=2720228 RepID=UPI001680AE48|nr:non-ribosomal peptide synthetase [Pseudoalteromonas sp. S16_S37]MBD1581821.1 amino acid adenylation domain-containing protein [Pseudoalteromonas sp. S16_S37]
MSNTTPASPLQISHFSQLQEDTDKQLSTASISCTYEGDLDSAKMQQYLANSLTELEILRTSYQSDEYGALWQQVASAISCNVTECDWRDLDDSQIEQAKQQLYAQKSDVSIEAAWHKLVLAKVPGKTWVYLEVSALNTDTYSIYAIFQGLVQAGATGKIIADEDELIQYGELAPWLADFLVEEEMAEARAFWSKDKSAAALESSLSLARYTHTEQSGYKAADIALGDIYADLQKVAGEHQATVAEVVCASLRITLSKYAPSAKLARAFAIRDDESLATAQGPLTRTLPLFPSTHSNFADAVRDEVDCTANGVDYVECFSKPYEYQQQGFSFCFDSIDCGQSASPAIEKLVYLNERCKIQFLLIEQGDATKLQVTYDQAEIDSDALAILLNACKSDLGSATGIELSQERDFLLQGKAIDAADATVLDMLTKSVSQGSGQIIEVHGASASLAEVDQRANRFAHHLISLGMNKGDVIALCLTRSIDFVVAMLAVLKVGGAYVPVDVSLPRQRIANMLQDAQAKALISAGNFEVEGCQGIDLSAADLSGYTADKPAIEVSGDDLAYILFTSGSTGRAKGVSISHRALVNQMSWINSAFDFTANDRFLQRTSASFDASVWEFWSPLLVGATMVIAPQDINYDMAQFLDVLTQQQISRMQLVPSLLELLTEKAGPSASNSLVTIFCGGEALKTQVARQAQNIFNCHIVNLYGPSECCVNATSWQYRSDLKTDFVPIGMPVNNLIMRVVKADGHLASQGESGELYIAGDSLFNGYYQQPELTFASLNEQLGDGRTYYKTGDYVQILADGNLLFQERLDDQVKLNGYRIEPEEVAMFVSNHGLATKATCLFNAQHNALALFYIDAQVSEKELIASLEAALPEYMVPQQVISLQEFPYLSNGKLDKRALLEQAINFSNQSYVAPTTETEKALIAIWQQLLDVPFKIGTNHDFFEIGGHSIAAMKVLNCIIEQFDINIGVRVLFEHKTVAQLASHIEPLILLNQDDEYASVSEEGGML